MDNEEKGAPALKCAVTNARADELPEPLDVILISTNKVKWLNKVFCLFGQFHCE